MANTNTPRGLQFRGMGGASQVNGAMRPYYVPATYATALYIGDPVVKTGTSNTTVVKVIGQAGQIGSMSEVNKATAGTNNPVTGVIAGFMPTSNQSLTYGAASTERVVLVYDDPNAEFEIQGSATVAATDVGNNIDFTFATSGSTVTGYSGVQADTTTVATAVASQMKIVSLANTLTNETGTNGKYIVRINNHTEAPNKAGI